MALLAWVWISRRVEDPTGPAATAVATRATPSAAAPLPASGANPPRPGAAAGDPQASIAPAANVTARLNEFLLEFRAPHDRAAAYAILRRLRETLHAIPDDEEAAAAAAIVAFLKTGEDAPTGLPFVVGADGMMDAVPTFRNALLDLLPSLDPLAALAVARELLDRKADADEYAMALRNLAWNDLDGDLRAELDRRFADMLKQPWFDQPSGGFLEAFDIAVELGSASSFGQMTEAARKAMSGSNSLVSRAAFMSMDRLILRAPQLLENALADPGWLDFAPEQRASLVSRLDLTRPGAETLFLRYLERAQPEELDYFADLFPNGNYLHGHRLVTGDDRARSIAEIAADDISVLEILARLETTAGDRGRMAIGRIRARLQRSQAGPADPE